MGIIKPRAYAVEPLLRKESGVLRGVQGCPILRVLCEGWVGL
jgi:hypothetical protein